MIKKRSKSCIHFNQRSLRLRVGLREGVIKLQATGYIQAAVCFCDASCLVHGHVHVCTYCLWLLSRYNSIDEEYDRDYKARKA